MVQYVYGEPEEYGFRDVHGHNGKFFRTESPITEHLLIECEDQLTVSMIQNKCEFSYYVLLGRGYFTIEGEKTSVGEGDLVVLPPGTKYTFGGQLKMLLVNTPHFDQKEGQVINDVEGVV